MSNSTAIDLKIQNVRGELLVDSRVLSERLGIEHGNFMETIGDYRNQIERAFGVVRFETEKPIKGSKGGRPQNYALLTEDHSIFLITLSRNTPEVVQCKIDLVIAFSAAKKLLKSDPTTLESLSVQNAQLLKLVDTLSLAANRAGLAGNKAIKEAEFLDKRLDKIRKQF